MSAYPGMTGKFNSLRGRLVWGRPICVCCLSQEGPFTTLLTCAHAGFFATITSFVMNEGTVVCKLCHNILMKFTLFRDQVIENIRVMQECSQEPIKKIYNLKIRVTSSLSIHSAMPSYYKPESLDPVITGVKSLAREVVSMKEAAIAREAAFAKEAAMAREAALAKEASLAKEIAPANEPMPNNDDNFKVEIEIEPDAIKQEIELDPLAILGQTPDRLPKVEGRGEVDRQHDDEGMHTDLESDIPLFHVIGPNKVEALGPTDSDKEQIDQIKQQIDKMGIILKPAASLLKPVNKVLSNKETYSSVMPTIVNSYGNAASYFHNVSMRQMSSATNVSGAVELPKATFRIPKSAIESQEATAFRIHNSAVQKPNNMRVYSGPSSHENAKDPKSNLLVSVPKDLITSILQPLVRIAPKPTPKDVKETIRIPNVTHVSKSTTEDENMFVSRLDAVYDGKLKPIKLTDEGVQQEREKRRQSSSYLGAPFKCESCVIPFSNEQSYEGHKKSRHSKGPWVCDICQVTTVSEASLNPHRARHYFKYKCEVCNEIYPDKRVAAKHYKEAHEDFEEKFHCNRCDFTSTTHLELRKHKRKEHLLKSCPVCKTRFMTDKKFEEHVRDCTTVTTYACHLCNKVSRTKAHLNTHMNTVHFEGPGQYCADCKIFFKHKYSLREHLMHSPRHRNNKYKKPEFQCDHCALSFHSKEIISRHIQQFHMPSDNICPICNKHFTSPFQLKVHHGIKHKEKIKDKPYICPHCVRTFAQQHLLSRHMRAHMDERPYKCVNCPATFKHQAARYTHNRMVHKVRGGTQKASGEVENTLKRVRKAPGEVKKASKKAKKAKGKDGKTLETPGTSETQPVIEESVENVGVIPDLVKFIENDEIEPFEVDMEWSLDNVNMASTSKNLVSTGENLASTGENLASTGEDLASTGENLALSRKKRKRTAKT